MDGREAHSAVLAAHATLRRMIAAIDVFVQRELEAPGAASSTLRTKAKELAVAVGRHIDTEEEMLRPILRRLDAWGPERVERMLADHVRQRRAIAELISLGQREAADAKALAHAVCVFVDDLLADMDEEENELLPPLLDDGEVLIVRQHAE